MIYLDPIYIAPAAQMRSCAFGANVVISWAAGAYRITSRAFSANILMYASHFLEDQSVGKVADRWIRHERRNPAASNSSGSEVAYSDESDPMQ